MSDEKDAITMDDILALEKRIDELKDIPWIIPVRTDIDVDLIQRVVDSDEKTKNVLAKILAWRTEK